MYYDNYVDIMSEFRKDKWHTDDADHADLHGSNPPFSFCIWDYHESNPWSSVSSASSACYSGYHCLNCKLQIIKN
jgi:hypothetical protein